MQRLIIETSPHEPEATESEYSFLRRCHGVRRMKALHVADCRILILRNPIERLCSLFTNKFVQHIGNSDIFDSYQSVTGRDPQNASFRDFLTSYVSRLGEVRLDPHVWPQHWHLCPVVYDRVFCLSELCRGMSKLFGPELAWQFFGEKINPSSEVDITIDNETRELIEKIYAQDFRLIERVMCS